MEKVIVDSLEGIPEPIHGFFKEAGEGKFEFDAVKSEDVTGLKNKVSQLLGEVKTGKEKLLAFDGIEDPAAALEAIEKLKSFDQKKMVDSGKLDELKTQLTEELNGRLAERDKAIGDLNTKYQKEMIGGRFSRSSFITESLVIPVDMVEATFGKFFEIEDGRVIAKDQGGQTITSEQNFGEPAGFDEALKKLVDAYPHKEKILKSETKPGSGMKGGDRVAGKGKALTRAQFDGLSPLEKTVFMKDGGKVND